MLDKKITKEISNLLTSSDKARKAISVEIDKIDAKYRALAEKEKSKLSKMIKSIEEQMESYKTLLGLGDEVESEVEIVEPDTVEEEEEKVVDTIFPENNEDPFAVAEVTEEQLIEEEPVAEETVVAENANEVFGEWPSEDTGSDAEEDKSDDENEWPAFPEEWK